MNQIMTAIKSRRSRRSFLEKGVPDDVINEILEAGRYAPSALNKQPWKFIVVTNRAAIKKLSSVVKTISGRMIANLALLRLFKSSLTDPRIVAAIKKVLGDSGDAVFFNAPLLIFVVADKKEHYAGKDCLLAAQNMMLYAHSAGVSSCFIGRADLLELSRAAKDLVGIPRRHAIQAVIAFGYSPAGNDQQAPPERRRDNVIKWVR